MTARARFSEADIRRAVKAGEKCGLLIAGYKIAPDGTIEILTAANDTAHVGNPLDRVLRR